MLVAAVVLAGFMTLDKTVLHWYVPESPDTASSASAGSGGLSANEARAVALAWVSQNFGSLDGYDCAEPELNAPESRWVAVCTERASESPAVKVVSVHSRTGVAAELVSQ